MRPGPLADRVATAIASDREDPSLLTWFGMRIESVTREPMEGEVGDEFRITVSVQHIQTEQIVDFPGQTWLAFRGIMLSAFGTRDLWRTTWLLKAVLDECLENYTPEQSGFTEESEVSPANRRRLHNLADRLVEMQAKP